MSSFDPAYIVVVVILVLGALGGYYLYRNALRASSDMDGPGKKDEEQE